MTIPRIFKKDRKASVLWASSQWTPELVDSIAPPTQSTRFRVFYMTMATGSHQAGSEWLSYPEHTPRQWIEQTFPDYRRVLSIVFDKA